MNPEQDFECDIHISHEVPALSIATFLLTRTPGQSIEILPSENLAVLGNNEYSLQVT